MDRFLRTSSDLSKGRLQNAASGEGAYLSVLQRPLFYACLYGLPASCERFVPTVFVSQLQLTFECFICRSFEDVSQLLTCNAHFVLEFVGMVNADLSFGVWVLLHWHCRVVDEAFDEVGVDAASDDVVVCFRTSLSRFIGLFICLRWKILLFWLEVISGYGFFTCCRLPPCYAASVYY